MTELARQLHVLLNRATAPAEPNAVVTAAEAVLDYATDTGDVAAHSTPDGFTLDTSSGSEVVHLDTPYTFRVLLARLGVQASSLAGRQVSLYGGVIEFAWRGRILRQEVENSKGLWFRIERKNRSTQVPLIVGKPASG